jgi:hypothetical protein
VVIRLKTQLLELRNPNETNVNGKKDKIPVSLFIIKNYYQKLNFKIKAHHHNINIQLFTSPGYAQCGREKNISS